MMAARDDARSNSFRDPRRNNVITDLRFDAQEIAGANIQVSGVTRVNPQRIRVRYFVEPFGIRTARVNLHGKSEGRDQDCLIFFETVRMNVTFDVNRERVLRPAPTVHGRRVELEASTRCRKAALDVAAGFYADETTPVCIAVGRWQRNDIWPGWFGCASKHASEIIHLRVIQFFRANRLIVNPADLLFDLKRTVATHETKRRQILFRSALR